MTDILRNVQEYHPDAETVCGKSWLYNLPQYRRLFPDSYLANLVINDDPFQLGRGSTVWGQLLDAQGHLKQEKAEAVLQQISAMPYAGKLSSLYKEDGPLLPPLTTFGPIADFYEMYGIE